MTDGDAIGIDVGGTKINAFRVQHDGRILERRQRPTPADDTEAMLEAMIGVTRSMREDGIATVGVGAAGLVQTGGVMRFSPNLAWRDVPIAARMRDAVGMPVLVENDATAAAYAEWRFGAGRGVRHLLLVAVGTGIGGGIVADGRLFRGAHGFAADIGHLIVEPGGPACGCGNRGCWEQVASGSTIDRLGRDAARGPSGAVLRDLAGGDADDVTGEHVTEAAERDDRAAIEVLERVGRRLGEGIAGLVNALDPELVVVGGGVVAAGERLLGPTRAAFRDAVEGADHRPDVPIVAAELGNDAGAIGAAVLALDALEGAG